MDAPGKSSIVFMLSAFKFIDDCDLRKGKQVVDSDVIFVRYQNLSTHR